MQNIILPWMNLEMSKKGTKWPLFENLLTKKILFQKVLYNIVHVEDTKAFTLKREISGILSRNNVII